MLEGARIGATSSAGTFEPVLDIQDSGGKREGRKLKPACGSKKSTRALRMRAMLILSPRARRRVGQATKVVSTKSCDFIGIRSVRVSPPVGMGHGHPRLYGGRATFPSDSSESSGFLDL